MVASQGSEIETIGREFSEESEFHPISWMKGAKVVLFSLSLVLGSVNREIR